MVGFVHSYAFAQTPVEDFQYLYDHIPKTPSSDGAFCLDVTDDGGFIVGGQVDANAGTFDPPYLMKLTRTGWVEWIRTLTHTTNPPMGHINDVVQLGDGAYVGVGRRTDLPGYLSFVVDADGNPLQQTSTGMGGTGHTMTAITLGGPTSGCSPHTPFAALATGHHHDGNSFVVMAHVIDCIDQMGALQETTWIIDDPTQSREDFAGGITRVGFNRVMIAGNTQTITGPTITPRQATIIDLGFASPGTVALNTGYQYGLPTGDEVFNDIIESVDEFGMVNGAIAVGYTNSYTGGQDLLIVAVDFNGIVRWSLVVNDGGNEVGNRLVQLDDRTVVVSGDRTVGPNTEGYLFSVEMIPGQDAPNIASMQSIIIHDGSVAANDFTSLSDIHVFDTDQYGVIGSTNEFGADYFNIFFRLFENPLCTDEFGEPTPIPHTITEEPYQLVQGGGGLPYEVAEAGEPEMQRSENCCTGTDGEYQDPFQWSYGGHRDRGHTGEAVQTVYKYSPTYEEIRSTYFVAGYTDESIKTIDALLVVTDSTGNSDALNTHTYRNRLKLRTGVWTGFDEFATFESNEWDELINGMSTEYEQPTGIRKYLIFLAGSLIPRGGETNNLRGDTNGLIFMVSEPNLKGGEELLLAGELGKSLPLGFYDQLGTERSTDVLQDVEWRRDVLSEYLLTVGYTNSALDQTAVDGVGRRYDALVFYGDATWPMLAAYEWMKTYHTGNSQADEKAYATEHIDTDGDGEEDDGIVVVGCYEESSSLGGALIFTLDNSGNIVNQKLYSHYVGSSMAGVETGFDVQQTDDDGDGREDDGFIVVGSARTHGDEDNNDLFILKVDQNLNKEWHRVIRLGSALQEVEDYAKSVDQTFDGGFIVTGTTNATSEAGASNTEQGFLLKLDVEGFPIWAVELPTDLDPTSVNNHETDQGLADHGEFVQQAADGGYIMAGSACSYSAPGTFVGKGDAWLVKTDCEGNVCKSRRILEFSLIDYNLDDFSDEHTLVEGPEVLEEYYPRGIDAQIKPYDCNGSMYEELCQYEACSETTSSIHIPSQNDKSLQDRRGAFPNFIYAENRQEHTATTGSNSVYLEKLSAATVVPDPVRSGANLHVSFGRELSGSVTITVLNAAGESVQTNSTILTNATSTHVATNGWPTGTYFITIETESESIRASVRVVD